MSYEEDPLYPLRDDETVCVDCWTTYHVSHHDCPNCAFWGNPSDR